MRLSRYGEGAGVEFPIEACATASGCRWARSRSKILATPGHTPESICIVVYEHPDDERPYGVLTGDTLFVGDVGRPDLLASAGADLSADALARRLYRSLRDKLLRLPDATSGLSRRMARVRPAASSCRPRRVRRSASNGW